MIVTQGRGDVCARAACGAHVWLLLSVLMFIPPEPPEAERIGLYRIGPWPSLAAALGRTSPAPHRLKHSGKRAAQ